MIICSNMCHDLPYDYISTIINLEERNKRETVTVYLQTCRQTNKVSFRGICSLKKMGSDNAFHIWDMDSAKWPKKKTEKKEKNCLRQNHLSKKN